MKHECPRCGGEVYDGVGSVWLELSTRTNKYSAPGTIPFKESQGCFLFGHSCAMATLAANGEAENPEKGVRLIARDDNSGARIRGLPELLVTRNAVSSDEVWESGSLIGWEIDQLVEHWTAAKAAMMRLRIPTCEEARRIASENGVEL